MAANTQPTPDPEPHGPAESAATPQGAPLRVASARAPAEARQRATRTARLLHVWLTFVTTASVVVFYGRDGSTGEVVATTAMACLVFVGSQLYERRSPTYARLSSLGSFMYRLRAVVLGAVLLGAASFYLPFMLVGPSEVAITAATLIVIGALWSLATRTVLGARALNRVLVVGWSSSVNDLVDQFRQDPPPEYEIVGIAADESDIDGGTGPTPSANGLLLLGASEDVEEIIDDHSIDTVVMAAQHGRLDIFGDLSSIKHPTFSVQELPAFSERAFGRVPVETINAAWFMYMINPFYRPYSRVSKRAADMAMAIIIGVALSWTVPIVALLVKLTSPGPVFYRQVRVGEHGDEFTIFKFRSMIPDAEIDGAQWASEDDPRITRFGSFIRATRLDEVPQLWNILRGQMSFVGPRPERPEFVDELEEAIPYYQRRHMVKPGLTGWAQVRMAYTDSIDGAADKLGFELYYLKHRSLLFDLVIFLETVRVVLFRFGSR